MARCTNCNTVMWGGYKSGEGAYCSLACYTASSLGDFCPECLAATTSDSPGGTFTFNSVGTRLFFSRDRCPKCHSIVQRKAVCALYIPLIPLAKYRVLYFGGNRYVGRKLRSDSDVRQAYSTGAPPIEPK